MKAPMVDAADFTGSTGSLDGADAAVPAPSTVLAAFCDKAQALGATVHLAPDARAALDRILDVAPEAAATPAATSRHPELAGHCRVLGVSTAAGNTGVAAASGAARGGGVTGSGAIAADVIVAAELGVAETGSVLLAETATSRGACFLAERLWVILRAREVVPSLEAALARAGTLVAGGARYVTLMSGPSRTADIERTVTVGVHGPREVTILVLAPGDVRATGATTITASPAAADTRPEPAP